MPNGTNLIGLCQGVGILLGEEVHSQSVLDIPSCCQASVLRELDPQGVEFSMNPVASVTIRIQLLHVAILDIVDSNLETRLAVKEH